MDRAPIVINFVMACYFSSDPESVVGSRQWNSPAGLSTRAWLKDNGLIGDDNRATERGTAWVGFICNTPLPESVWVLPQREAA